MWMVAAIERECCDSVLVLALLTHGRTSLPSRSDAHDVDVLILTS